MPPDQLKRLRRRHAVSAHAAVALLALAAVVASATAAVTSHTLTLSTALNAASATSPTVIGVNAGHRAVNDTSWLAFMQHAGVNGYRLFGLGGLGNQASLQSVAASAPGATAAMWGRDMRGAPVTNLQSFNAAVATLRAPSGHDPSRATSFAYPPAWAQIDANNAAQSSDATSGSPNNTIAQVAAALGMRPVVVMQLGCGSFSFSTLDASTATYWAEHWEVWKHTYATASWLWRRGITSIEQHNEPDLTANNACLPDPSDSPGAPYWSDYYLLRNSAITAAYTDLNADVAAGTVACPAGVTCPLALRLLSSAFASVYLRAGEYTGITMALEHTQFPPSLGVNASYTNMHVYSFHSYGKSGSQLAGVAADVATGVAAAHTGPGVVPIAITEYAPQTNGAWQGDVTSSDTPRQAARFGAQLLYTAAAGIETYAFKLSMQPYSNSANKVAKSGLHFADNGVAPYSVGDPTLSGAVLALAAPVLAGARPLLSCTGFTSVYQKCLLVKDGSARAYHILVVNDFADDTGAPDRQLALPLAPLGVSGASFAVVSEVSDGASFGEAVLFVPISALPGASTLSYLLPAWATARITVPIAAQGVSVLTATADATLRAGASAGFTYGRDATLAVNTSPTATHDSTAVALLQFATPTFSTALNVALLELTVASAPPSNGAAVVLSVIGVNPAAPRAWAEANITWTDAPWLVTAPSGVISCISQNFALLGPGTGNGNWLVGHITVQPGERNVTKRLDVTRFVAAAASGNACSVTFALVRRFRRNLASPASSAGETIPADDLSGGGVAFWSREAGAAASAPTLRLLSDAASQQRACSAAATAPATSGTPAPAASNAAAPSPPSGVRSAGVMPALHAAALCFLVSLFFMNSI